MSHKSDKQPTFAQLVCGAQSVRTAFEFYAPARLWWRLILMLHGKPTNPSLSPQQETRQIAAGFRFYAWLYRFLATLFLLLGPALIAADSGEGDLSYWAASSVLTGVTLWFVSGLGFCGARDYLENPARGTIILIAFMTMIVAFLSAFVAVISAVAAQLNGLATAPNLAATGLLFVFGIGSYFIEIVWLASRQTRAL